MLGRTKMAYLWADKELKIDRYCKGDNRPEYT